MSDEKQLAGGTVGTEQPTMQLRWYQPPPVDCHPSTPVLQQLWQILIFAYDTGAASQRFEWRDVPTVTP